MHFVIPSLLRSVTMALWHYTTVPCHGMIHNFIMALCQCITVSLCKSITKLQYHGAILSLNHNCIMKPQYSVVTMSLFIASLRHIVTIQLHRSVTKSLRYRIEMLLCHCAVSLYHIITSSQRHYDSLSLHYSVIISFCHKVTV